jgi:hypothetical protein
MTAKVHVTVDLRTDHDAPPEIDGAYSHVAAVEEAAHHMGKSYPGGMDALATKSGMVPSTLRVKLNPAQNSHRLSLAEAVHISKVAGSSAIAQAFCNELGGIYLRRTPAPSEDPLVLLAECGYALGQLQWQVSGNHQRTGLNVVTKNDMRNAEHAAEELINSTQNLLAHLRSKMQAAPSVGY